MKVKGLENPSQWARFRFASDVLVQSRTPTYSHIVVTCKSLKRTP